jgi:hypothetical protein
MSLQGVNHLLFQTIQKEAIIRIINIESLKIIMRLILISASMMTRLGTP